MCIADLSDPCEVSAQPTEETLYFRDAGAVWGP